MGWGRMGMSTFFGLLKYSAITDLEIQTVFSEAAFIPLTFRLSAS